MDCLVILFFFGIVSVFVIFTHFQAFKQQAERLVQLHKMSAELGVIFRENHSSVTGQIKELMNGSRSAWVSDSFQFPYRGGSIIVADYSHVVKSGKSSRRVHRTVVAIRIVEGHLPRFKLTQSGFFDNVSHWFGRPTVDLQWKQDFNDRMALRTRPDDVEEVRAYFERHDSLTDFILANPNFVMQSNGHWLVFYKPRERLEVNAAVYRDRFQLAMKLYDCLWPNSGGSSKAASFESLIEESDDDFWHADGKSYDEYIESLKE